MKTSKDMIAPLLGVIAQVPIEWCLWCAHALSVTFWQEVLEGKPLPWLTTASLSLVRYIPVFSAMCILIGLIGATTRKYIVWWTFVVILIEAVLLAFASLGLCYPGMSITWSLSGT